MRVGRWLSDVLRVLAWLLEVVVGGGCDSLSTYERAGSICVVGEAQRAESGVGIVVCGRACGVGSFGVRAVECSLFVLSVCCGVQRREVSVCGGG